MRMSRSTSSHWVWLKDSSLQMWVADCTQRLWKPAPLCILELYSVSQAPLLCYRRRRMRTWLRRSMKTLASSFLLPPLCHRMALPSENSWDQLVFKERIHVVLQKGASARCHTKCGPCTSGTGNCTEWVKYSEWLACIVAKYECGWQKCAHGKQAQNMSICIYAVDQSTKQHTNKPLTQGTGRLSVQLYGWLSIYMPLLARFCKRKNPFPCTWKRVCGVTKFTWSLLGISIVFTSSRSCACMLHQYGQHTHRKVAHWVAFPHAEMRSWKWWRRNALEWLFCSRKRAHGKPAHDWQKEMMNFWILGKLVYSGKWLVDIIWVATPKYIMPVT